MKKIINNQEKILKLKKSKFITYTKKVLTEKDALNFLKEIKEKYQDATHVCYAYIIDNHQKYSDDGEPSNTAGKPMFDILTKNNLNYVISIVIRYFGGIKLGSNGLIRAYSSCVKETINENVKEIEYGYKIIIREDYQKEKIINYLLKNSTIIKKNYQEEIYIEAIIKKEVLDTLTNINFQVVSEIIL